MAHAQRQDPQHAASPQPRTPRARNPQPSQQQRYVDGADAVRIEPSWTDPRFLVPLALFLLAVFVIGLAFRANSVNSGQSTAAEVPDTVAAVMAAETRAGFGNVNVRSENGLIILEGQAQTSSDAAAIGAVARSVEGVGTVDNRLVIVGGAIELPTPEPAATVAPAQTPGLQERLSSVGRITFETSSSALTPEGSATVDAAAALLTQNPGVRVDVHGHTDSDGESVFNQQLSQERAEAVVEALRVRGVDPGRLTAIGFGESNPIEPNITEEGRAVNRRIEFLVVP